MPTTSSSLVEVATRPTHGSVGRVRGARGAAVTPKARAGIILICANSRPSAGARRANAHHTDRSTSHRESAVTQKRRAVEERAVATRQKGVVITPASQITVVAAHSRHRTGHTYKSLPLFRRQSRISYRHPEPHPSLYDAVLVMPLPRWSRQILSTIAKV